MGNPRHDLGARAEQAVADWLTAAGWRVLARRFRVPSGEIDLVCLDPDGVLVGVEVRARRSGRTGTPVESIDRHRLRRRRAALASYAAVSTMPYRDLRLDLVSLTPADTDDGAGWLLSRQPAVDGW